MHLFNCPVCLRENDATDHLPELACHDNDFTCKCGAELEIGWYAVVEVRNVKIIDPIEDAIALSKEQKNE